MMGVAVSSLQIDKLDFKEFTKCVIFYMRVILEEVCLRLRIQSGRHELSQILLKFPAS